MTLFLTSASGVVADPVGPVLPPDSIIADRDLAWYAQDWWQWAFSMPTDQSPIQDPDGRLCGVNQDGPVWYLAGGFGTARVHRTCSVPAGRFLGSDAGGGRIVTLCRRGRALTMPYVLLYPHLPRFRQARPSRTIV